MRKRLITAFILIFYSAFIIKLLVFKFDLIKIGHLKFKFSPETGEGNIIPFKTILFYMRGKPNWSMAILNLVGNIALFVPIGFLLPFVYRKLTWRKCLAIAIALGFTIEGMELVFRVGIFDIDDVILNALGVMIGYWASIILLKWRRPQLESV